MRRSHPHRRAKWEYLLRKSTYRYASRANSLQVLYNSLIKAKEATDVNRPILEERTHHLCNHQSPQIDELYQFRDMDGNERDMARFQEKPELYVAILTGAGNKPSCAGDLKEMLNDPVSVPWKTIEESRELAWNGPGFDGITLGMEFWKPIIVAINGYCIAGGNEIALACDIRIATEHAEFGHQEIRWCMIPGDDCCPQRLPRVIGLGRALELILIGERISAQEAYRIGLVNKVVPAERLMSEATKVAETICQRSQLSVHACKEAIIRGIGAPLREGLAYENLLLQQLFTTEDRLEGSQAFAEKRAPRWKNRLKVGHCAAQV